MNRDHVVKLVQTIELDKSKATAIVELLELEGVINLDFGNKDVDLIVNTYKNVFGVTKTSRYDRYAATRLAKKHTAKVVCEIIQLMGQNGGSRFAPVVGSVSQLETKWVNVIKFLRSTQVERVEL